MLKLFLGIKCAFVLSVYNFILSPGVLRVYYSVAVRRW